MDDPANGGKRKVEREMRRCIRGGAQLAADDRPEAAADVGVDLVADGWFETDDVGLPALRLGPGDGRRPLSAVEDAVIASNEPALTVRFPGALPSA